MNPTLPTISLTVTEYNSLPRRDWHSGEQYEGEMWRDSAGRVRILIWRGDHLVATAATWVRIPHRRLSVFPPGWMESACRYLRRWPESGAGVWLVRRWNRRAR